MLRKIMLMPLIVILSFVFLFPTSPVLAGQSETGTIKGAVAVIMRNGDVKPLARRWFMVSPFSVLEQRKLLSPGASAENKQKWLDVIEEFYSKAASENKVYFVQTDFQGNYELSGLPPGRYCIEDDSYRVGPREWNIISSNSPIGKCFINWSYWFEVKGGQNLKIDLSNDNSKSSTCY